ncbi:hypothetical protein PQR75_45425 [Paraburkholderia fungorum]|uniref:hypothetical protein n=1 Tax=Paraburkholderia fungorum TaxID=134537 RepID=UPI0038B715F4
MTIKGIYRIKTSRPDAENLVLVTDGDNQFEVTEGDYSRGHYSPALQDLPWKP